MADNEVKAIQKVKTEENPLGTEPIRKLLRNFAFPSCISMVVNALYNIVDQIFIGRGVGYLGNGATNVIMPIMILGIAIGLLFGDGCAAFYSMQLGRKRENEAAKGVGTAFLGAVLVAVVLDILLNLFLEPFCNLAGATETILPYAMDYGRIIAVGLPFSVLSCSLSSIIRADGSPKYSMAGLLLGCGINVVFDYVFVFPLGMGVSGAALATILGQIANTILYLVYFTRFKHVKITKDIFRIRPAYLGRVCRLGVSSFVLQMSVVVVIIVSNKLLVYWGGLSEYGSDIPLAAMGVTMKINNILIAIMNGIAAGSLPIIGFNYGAGNLDRVKKTIKMAVGVAMFCGVIATLCFQLFPEQIVAIFGEESELYVEFGVKCLRIHLMLCILDGLNNVIPTCYQSVGRPGYAVFCSLMRNLVIAIPVMCIFPFFMGVTGVLMFGPVSAGAAFVMNLFLSKKIFRDLDRELGK